MTKSDKELLKIYKMHNCSTRYYWIYNKLTGEEKSRLFDLLIIVNLKENGLDKLYALIP